MDILKALRELYNEKKRLDVAISSLEARLKAPRTGSAANPAKARRGRKSMCAAERLEVSKRMTLYWEARRAQALPTQSAPQSPSEEPSSDPTPPKDQQASSSSMS
jgi:hypothetical protein